MIRFFREHRAFFLTTHLYFIVTAVMAVWLFRERIFADAAYYLLHVVDSESFRIEHQRFILAPAQVLALLGAKFGLSLKAVMILNSLNPVIYFYVLFLYVVVRLRDNTAGIALLLVQTLGVLHMYFCPMYEIWYGTALLVPIYSHLRNNRHSGWIDVILLSGMIVTALFAHPLIFIALLCLILLDASGKWYANRKQLILFALLFIGWYLAKKFLLSDYETGKMNLLDTANNKSYENLLKGAYLWSLVKYLFTYYTVPMILFLFTVFFYLVRGARFKALVLCGFFIGEILLINFTHENYPEQSLYFERMYMPIVTMSLLPFLYDVFTAVTLHNAIGGTAIALMIGWRLWLFADISKVYTERLDKTNRVIAEAHKTPGSKYILDNDDFHSCYNFVEWSFPMETLLYSAIEGKDKCVTVVVHDDLDAENNRKRLNDGNFLFRRWDLRLNRQINPRYFLIKPGAYQQLKPLCK